MIQARTQSYTKMRQAKVDVGDVGIKSRRNERRTEPFGVPALNAESKDKVSKKDQAGAKKIQAKS